MLIGGAHVLLPPTSCPWYRVALFLWGIRFGTIRARALPRGVTLQYPTDTCPLATYLGGWLLVGAPYHPYALSTRTYALDVVVARRFDLAGAAGILGITMSQLSRLIHHDKAAFARVNEGRVEVGLPPIRK